LDGIQNLNEFAYGLNPGIAEGGGNPYFHFQDGTLDFIFRCRSEGFGSMATPYTVDGIRYQLEMSPSLESGNWYPVPGYFTFLGIEENGDPDINTVRLRLREFSSLDPSNPAFFRLRVSEE